VSAPDWTAGQVVGGKYTVKAVLRRGERTATYSAIAIEDPPREVVLRAVGKDDASSLDAFAARVPELAGLPAPYVLRVLEVSTDEETGARFVASEHARHPSLASLIALGTLTIGEAITLANELARIVDAAHDKRVLHLGLKPTSVFVGTMLTGGVEVSDFELPELDDTFERKRWLAPEQLEGAPATAAADVFSTALLVFHAITGKHYWSATTIEELRAEMEAPLIAPWKRADEHGVTLPPEMDEVFVKALSHAPAERPRRVADFARALDAAPKTVISVPPPPMDLVASLAATENAALPGAPAEAPITPEVIVPLGGPAPVEGISPPLRPPPAAPVDARPPIHAAPPVGEDEARRRKLVVVGVLGGAAAILMLGLVASAFRHCGSGAVPVASASAVAATVASIAEPTAAAPPPPPPPQATEAPPPPVAEVDAAPPAPALGPDESELLVLCEPACNVVMVDRKSMTGYSDAMKLPPGKHGVGVSSPGYYGDWKLVTTKPGERSTVTFLLTKKPPTPTKPPKRR
jgi:serine/threonine-protein kinase